MDTQAISISDEDRDRIHILPLSMIPLSAKVLKKTRMVKNSHLESGVELYKGDETGSGQISIGQLRTVFRDISYDDINILQSLSKLHSYDVFSLRRLLRELEIDVDDHADLQLSDDKQNELAGYMKLFTRPLIVKLYGNDGLDIQKPRDMADLFDHPDQNLVLHNLKMFAQTLSIRVYEIPKMLDDYGDLYMSISYYRQLLNSIGPIIGQFNASIDEIRSNRQLQQNQNLIKNCTQIQTKFKGMTGNVLRHFKTFDEMSKTMWDSDGPEAMGNFGSSIRGSQTALGGILCALTVKMNDWQSHFPHQDVGGPMKWADYVVNEMRQGLEAY
jgi:hypothetical protein